MYNNANRSEVADKILITYFDVQQSADNIPLLKTALINCLGRTSKLVLPISENEALFQFTQMICSLGYQDEAHGIYKHLIFERHFINKKIYTAFLINILMNSNVPNRSEEFFTYVQKYNEYFYPSYSDNLYAKFLKALRFGKLQNKLKQGKKLNVAYTCHFFGVDTSKKLYNPVIKNHDSEKFNIFIYSDNEANRDESDIANAAHKYVNTYGFSTKQFIKQIVRDDIDVFFDNNGHLPSNRYLEVALDVAPVSITYFNCPYSTGLEHMDFMLAPKYISLESVKQYYTEEIVYLDGTIHAVEFPYDMPEVTPLPYLENGYITFCSFGSLNKVSKELLAVFCNILKQVPHSRLLLKYPNAFDKTVDAKEIWMNHFKENKIDPSRITFMGAVDSFNDLYKLYNTVDIALDTFPYNAGTTTIDALYMGVPVVAKYNQDYDGQHSVSTLKAIGYEELLCKTQEEYVQKAVMLAGDTDKLKTMRARLRSDMQASPQCDVKQYTRNIEAAIVSCYNKKVA